jgi:hypothetical protein
VGDAKTQPDNLYDIANAGHWISGKHFKNLNWANSTQLKYLARQTQLRLGFGPGLCSHSLIRSVQILVLTTRIWWHVTLRKTPNAYFQSIMKSQIPSAQTRCLCDQSLSLFRDSMLGLEPDITPTKIFRAFSAMDSDCHQHGDSGPDVVQSYWSGPPQGLLSMCRILIIHMGRTLLYHFETLLLDLSQTVN